MSGCEDAAVQSTFPPVRAHTRPLSLLRPHSPAILHSLRLPSPRSPHLLPPLPQMHLPHRGPFRPASAPRCLTWLGRRQEVGRAASGWRRLPGGRCGALAPAPARAGRGPRPPPVAIETPAALFVTWAEKGL